jgi:peptide-methionine (S)-S-oxide reductase
MLVVGALAMLLAAPVAGQTPAADGGRAKATFAGGCFWCMEPPFESLDGVISVTSGYTGGHKPNPTYEAVSSGTTGHAEAVQIVYDPSRIGYERLLDVFWHNIDPITPNAQFCDHGEQYRSAIFYHDDTQRRLAEASKHRLEQSKRFDCPSHQIVPATEFPGRGVPPCPPEESGAVQVPLELRTRSTSARALGLADRALVVDPCDSDVIARLLAARLPAVTFSQSPTSNRQQLAAGSLPTETVRLPVRTDGVSRARGRCPRASVV